MPVFGSTSPQRQFTQNGRARNSAGMRSNSAVTVVALRATHERLGGKPRSGLRLVVSQDRRLERGPAVETGDGVSAAAYGLERSAVVQLSELERLSSPLRRSNAARRRCPCFSTASAMRAPGISVPRCAVAAECVHGLGGVLELSGLEVGKVLRVEALALAMLGGG